jgi:hypothetical protein
MFSVLNNAPDPDLLGSGSHIKFMDPDPDSYSFSALLTNKLKLSNLYYHIDITKSYF